MSVQVQLDLLINNAAAVKSVGEAKAALKDLKGALAFGIDEKDTASIKKAEEAYKSLKDKVDDVTDSLKANAQDGLSRVGDQFKYIKDRIFELDFSKASSGLANLRNTVSSINFKDISTGVKLFGESLGQLGKATYTALGPWGLLAAAIVAVIGVLYSLKDIIKPIGDAFNFLGRVFDSILQKFREFSDAVFGTNLVAKKNAEQTLQNAQHEEDIIKQSYDNRIKLMEANRQNTYTIKQKEYEALSTQLNKEVEAYKLANQRQIDDIEERNAKGLALNDEQSKIQEELFKKIKALDDNRTEQKVAKINEETRIVKLNLQLQTDEYLANANAKIVIIKDEHDKSIAAEKARYIAQKNQYKQYFLDNKLDTTQQNTYIETKQQEHKNILLGIDKQYQEAERLALIQQETIKLNTLQLYQTKDIDMVNQMSVLRLSIIDKEEAEKKAKYKVGSEQRIAIEKDAEYKRKQNSIQTNNEINTLQNKYFTDAYKNVSNFNELTYTQFIQQKNKIAEVMSKVLGDKDIAKEGTKNLIKYEQFYPGYGVLPAAQTAPSTNKEGTGAGDIFNERLNGLYKYAGNQIKNLLNDSQGIKGESPEFYKYFEDNYKKTLNSGNYTVKTLTDELIAKFPQQSESMQNFLDNLTTINNETTDTYRKLTQNSLLDQKTATKQNIGTETNDLSKNFLADQLSMNFDKQKEYYDKVYALKQKDLENDKEAALIKAKTLEEYNYISSDYALKEDELKEEKRKADIDREKARIQERMDIEKNLISGITDLTDAFFTVKADNARGDVEKENKIAEQKFNINKSLMLSLSVPQLAENILLGLKSVNAALTPIDRAFAIAQLVSNTAQGVAQVAKISTSRYQRTGGTAATSTSSAPPISMYGTNGGGGINNLGVQNPNQRETLKVYVVENDIAIAQSNVARYRTAVTLG